MAPSGQSNALSSCRLLTHSGHCVAKILDSAYNDAVKRGPEANHASAEDAGDGDKEGRQAAIGGQAEGA